MQQYKQTTTIPSCLAHPLSSLHISNFFPHFPQIFAIFDYSKAY